MANNWEISTPANTTWISWRRFDGLSNWGSKLTLVRACFRGGSATTMVIRSTQRQGFSAAEVTLKPRRWRREDSGRNSPVSVAPVRRCR